ncbi:MAG TPA: twin-arginine translocase TatA/TatE family subunit [Syntrophomonadaceae bacterium]|nr:twin-arginine translocase TatA/TatE family subunit [Syntrophomonadaceae bacterium]
MFTNLLQPTHLILILIIVLIVIGPGKLPDIGQAMGKAIKEFKQNSSADKDADDSSLDKK